MTFKLDKAEVHLRFLTSTIISNASSKLLAIQAGISIECLLQESLV